MGYEKPKVTIDLEEYNDLLKAKNEKYDPDEVATLAATIALNLKENQNMIYVRDAVCNHVDYLIDINIISDYTRESRAIAKVIKKPIR